MTPSPPPGQGPVSPPGMPHYPMRGGMPPQPGMYPPFMMMPPRQGGGFAKAILVTLATTIFGLSILLNVYLLFAMALTSSSSADPNEISTVEQTISAGDPKQKVAVVRFDGVISEESKRPFLLLLDKVERDADVKALVIEVDSPGGGVTPSDEIYDRILRFKQTRQIPVVISMSSLAASGGYYFSMAGDRIWAQETTLTGSIGVLFQRFDLSDFANKYGVKDGTIVSDGATFKDAGSMMKPLDDAELTYFKALLNEAFDTFKARIASGRPKMTKQQIDTAANGKIYSAKQAKTLGLIDSIGYLDDAIADAATIAKLTSPQAVRIDRELSFFERLSGGAQGAASTSGVQGSVGGVNLKVDRSLVDEFTRPRLMYLWQGM